MNRTNLVSGTHSIALLCPGSVDGSPAEADGQILGFWTMSLEETYVPKAHRFRWHLISGFQYIGYSTIAKNACKDTGKYLLQLCFCAWSQEVYFPGSQSITAADFVIKPLLTSIDISEFRALSSSGASANKIQPRVFWIERILSHS